jgi:hypothetical protein
VVVALTGLQAVLKNMLLIIGVVKKIKGIREVRSISNTNSRFTFEMEHSLLKNSKHDYMKKYSKPLPSE